jgi:membrane protease YdiL (CAAX protease family)
MKSVALYSPEDAQGWLPWAAAAPFLCIVMVAVPDLLAALALQPFHMVDKNGDPIGALGFCLFLLVTFGPMGLVFAGWMRFVERRPLATAGLVGSHPARTFLRGLAIGLAMSSAIVAAIWIAGGYHAGGWFRAFGSRDALFYIAALLAGFALQSSVEEFIFRGWLLSGIARKLNVPIAVILVSATFTLLHYDVKQHWATTATTFLFSVFACAWSIRSGNIWGVMGWHAGWNWLLAVGFELPVTGLNAGLPALLVKLNPIGSVLTTGGAQGPEGSIWCNLLLVAGIGFVLLLPRRGVVGAPATRAVTPD